MTPQPVQSKASSSSEESTEEESTELGEVPHDEKKGTMDHQVRPYGYQYMYSILREMLGG